MRQLRISRGAQVAIFCSFSVIGVSSYFVYNHFTRCLGALVDCSYSIFENDKVNRFYSRLCHGLFGCAISFDRISSIDDNYLLITNLQIHGNSAKIPRASYQFKIKELKVALSLKKLVFERRGIIKSVYVDGMDGKIIQLEDFDYSNQENLVKNLYSPNLFEADEESLVLNSTINFQYPYPFRSFLLKIRQGVFPQLSSYYFFYNILQATYIDGELDGSAFTYSVPFHKSGTNAADSSFRKLSIKNLSIAHFRENSNPSSIFNLLSRGVVDITAIVSFPQVAKGVQSIYSGGRQMGEAVSFTDRLNFYFRSRIPFRVERFTLQPENSPVTIMEVNTPLSSIGFSIQVILKELKLPFRSSLSKNEDLFLRYITETRTEIPLSFSFEMDKVGDFGGAWTPYTAGLSGRIKENFTWSLCRFFDTEQSSPSFLFRFGYWGISSLIAHSRKSLISTIDGTKSLNHDVPLIQT